MPIHMPRLIRDAKSGFYFFRLVLPRSVAGLQQKSMYFSLKTRENKVARVKAAVFNLRVQMAEPYIDFDNIRELINIDLKNGIFQEDTPEEHERGLKILQATYKNFANKPDCFWGPLIYLYSGMRPEEITTLEIENIKQDDGVYFFRIKDAKTPAGARAVPIHSQLIRMGLFDYLTKIKEKEKLFWYLKDGHNGTKKNLSRRFFEYLGEIEVKQDDNYFYSLQHTVITRLVVRKVNNSSSRSIKTLLCGLSNLTFSWFSFISS